MFCSMTSAGITSLFLIVRGTSKKNLRTNRRRVFDPFDPKLQAVA
jgi:hypothetical protein